MQSFNYVLYCLDGIISCSLQEVVVPSVSLGLCNVGYQGSIKAIQMCAGFRSGGKDSCQVGKPFSLFTLDVSCTANLYVI